MLGLSNKDDVRIIRTRAALTDSLLTLLKSQNFGKLTVNNLCEEAQISRPTFYSHFSDKYRLLAFCLSAIRLELLQQYYEVNMVSCLEDMVIKTILDNKKIIANLVEDANYETLDLLQEFMISLLYSFMDKNECEEEKLTPWYIIFTNFYTGGVLNLLLWQIKNRFPPDHLPEMTHYFFVLVEHLIKLENTQNPPIPPDPSEGPPDPKA